jgi:hypothetical protein
MRKRYVVVLVAVVMLCVGVMGASAQLRLDMDVNVPLYFGYSTAGASDGAWNSYFIPFPDARLAYQFGGGLVDVGVGARVFTFIIENILYPEAYVELNLDRVTFSLNLGGFAFLEFGLLSTALNNAGVKNLTGFHSVILPDLNVAYRVNDWFRLGGGVFMIAPFGNGMGGVLDNFVYSVYINARFVVMFK